MVNIFLFSFSDLIEPCIIIDNFCPRFEHVVQRMQGIDEANLFRVCMCSFSKAKVTIAVSENHQAAYKNSSVFKRLRYTNL